MKVGSEVSIKHSTLMGKVIQRRVGPGDIDEHLVEFADNEGENQQRWFVEGEIVVKEEVK